MANEIQFASSLTVTNGGITAAQTVNATATQATPGVLQNRQTITTGGGTISFTGLTAARWILIKNTDATNFIDIGPDSTGLVALARLLPGESMQFPRKAGVTVKALANTGSVIIELTALET